MEQGSLSVSGAAARLGISEGAVRYRIKNGQLRSLRDARGRVRVPRSAVTSALAVESEGWHDPDELQALREEAARLRELLRSLLAARDKTADAIRAALDAERILADSALALLSDSRMPNHPEVRGTGPVRRP